MNTTHSKINYSIVIPAFNEEYFIGKNITSIKKLRTDVEIIIADGGSTDKTLLLCADNRVKIVHSKKGRGAQLNAGANASTVDVIVFLHADTFLPDNAFVLLDNYFSNSGKKVCRFELAFDVDHEVLRLYSKFSKYDTLFTRFGDSSIIIRKELFHQMGGFPDVKLFEDVIFLNKVKKECRIDILPSTVTSSSRRFIKNGIVKQQLLNMLLFIGYFIKVKPDTLTSIYNLKMNNKNKSALIIFLKYPKQGAVKTRLAATTSQDFALHFYKECVKKILNEIRIIRRVNKFIFYSVKNEKEQIIRWIGNGFFYSAQEGEELGDRMKYSFETVYNLGSEKVVIIGTDVPDLTRNIILLAFQKLDEYEVVIGPSDDGGYYLLGMNKNNSKLFEGIEYSTASVYADTVSKIEELGLSYYVLPKLKDIDTEAELNKWLDDPKSSDLKREIELVYNLNKGKVKQRCTHCA